jgi:hypothetical protein
MPAWECKLISSSVISAATRNLVASERLREEARQADAQATAEDIILATDQAFYQALQEQTNAGRGHANRENQAGSRGPGKWTYII